MMITIKKLSLQLSKQTVLENVNLEIEAGEICCILGKNGAGKTSLFKCILGVVEPDSGEISIENTSMNVSNRIEILHSIGVLLDHSIAYEHLSVWENLSIIAKLYNIEDSNTCEQMLVFFGLENDKHKLVRHLSSGMKQRLGLAISNVHNPKILLLDEPTNVLDPQAVIEFRYLMKQLNQNKNTTILFNTHNLDEAQRISNRIVILKDGYIIFDSKLQKIENFEVIEFRKDDFSKIELKDDFYEKDGYLCKLHDLLNQKDSITIKTDIPPRKATIEDIYLAKHHAIL